MPLFSSTSLRVACGKPGRSDGHLAGVAGRRWTRRGVRSRAVDTSWNKSRFSWFGLYARLDFMPLFLLLLGCTPVFRNGAGGDALLLCRSDPRWIACRSGEVQSRFNKSVCCTCSFADQDVERSSLSLAGRGGEKRKVCCYSPSRSVEWLWSRCVLALKRGVGRRPRSFSGMFPWWKLKQEIGRAHV